MADAFEMRARNSEKSESLQLASRFDQDAYDRDIIDLAKAGKKPVLKRRFGLISMTGFTSTIMITWEGTLDNFTFGLLNGGPAGLIYQFLITWAGTLSVFIAMAELASMFPAAGGQYHWASILAPPTHKKIISYITGWITVATWVLTATAASYVAGQLVFVTIQISIPEFNPTGWQGTLIMWAVLLVDVLFNTVFGAALPAFEIIILLVHTLGFFGTLIPLVYSAPRGNAHEIFTQFFNLGGWETTTLSFFIGLRGNAAAFLGTDGAIHMSEEVENSAVNVPKAIIYAIMLNGTLGFAMLIAALFSGGDLMEVAGVSTNFPYTIIFANALGNTGAAVALSSILAFLNNVCAISSVASGSRMLWSFARDRGVPGWQTFRKVDHKTSIPVTSVLFVVICAALLGLINIGSSTVFLDVVSLILEGFYTSYLFAISLLLYRRIQGHIADPGDDSLTVEQHGAPGDPIYVWGPWRVKGWIGTANNIVACIYLIVIIFFGFWPSTVNVTAENMNYSIVIMGAIVIGSLVYYMIQGRKTYTGPIVELQIAETVEAAKNRVV